MQKEEKQKRAESAQERKPLPQYARQVAVNVPRERLIKTNGRTRKRGTPPRLCNVGNKKIT